MADITKPGSIISQVLPKPRSPQPKAPEEKEQGEKQDIFLCVGTSQAGKSTFLDLAHKICGQDADIPMGTGNKACTVKCTKYELTFSPSEHDFFKALNSETTEGLEQQTVGSKGRQAFLDRICEKFPHPSLPPSEVLGPQRVLSFIDTPGLEDSNANADEENVVKILQFLSTNVTEITAVLFFIQRGQSYSGRFQKILGYYTQLLSSIKDRFIIVHTDWSPFKEDITEQKLFLRETEFSDVAHALEIRPQHFFIDSFISEYNHIRNPYSHIKKAFTYSDFTTIVTSAHGWPNVKLSQLDYVKSDIVRVQDDFMIQNLTGVETGVTAALKITESSLQTSNAEIVFLENKIAEKKELLANCNDRLKVIDTTEREVIGVASFDHGFGGWNSFQIITLWQKRDLVVVTTVPIESTSRNLGNRYCAFDGKTVVSDNCLTATQTVCSNAYGGISGTLTAFCRKQTIHAQEILKLRNDVHLLTDEIHTLEGKKDHFESKHGAEDAQLNNFRQIARSAGQLKARLRANRIPVQEFLKIRHIYLHGTTDGEALLANYCSFLDITQPKL